MVSETALIILLGALVVALSALLLTRILGEKREMGAIRRMNLSVFSDFLRANSREGNIQQVAGKVSDLLKTSFGCERIVFLRKKRNVLELNYYHGLDSFNRRDFRVPYHHRLSEELRKDFLPRDIEVLAPLLPDRLNRQLTSLGADVFFPIFWRENLYGIYFIRSTIETRSPSFSVLTASIAQSLSAAYHIKWHESKHDQLKKRLDDVRLVAQKGARGGQLRRNSILKLVKHRNSETIVPKIVSAIKSDLEMKRIAYVYENKGEAALPVMFREGVDSDVDAPDKKVFDEVIGILSDSEPRELAAFIAGHPAVGEWTRQLKAGGLDYIVSFPLSSKRSGIIVWASDEPLQATSRQLGFLKPHTMELVESAESYQKIEEMSFTDNLTGLANQRYFSKRLNEEVSRAERYGRKLALILFDLDQLKIINDKYGHLAGDTILKQMGEILRNSIRSIDIIARYGGDEFCIIMPEADARTCVRFMERFKEEIARSEFLIEGVDGVVRCTASFGGAIFPDHAGQPKMLIHNADMALLKAKESGRNNYLLYS